jgi:uncharacterized protein
MAASKTSRVPHVEPFFLSIEGQSRFCLLHRPTPPLGRAGVVFVHPFAEEMNRCRRMAALQARAFARTGRAVLQMDLLGCGDSAGDFGEATWLRWIEDIKAAITWMDRETGTRPMLWSVRGGALLAGAVAQAMQPAPDMVLWQPSLSGRQVLQQFLRLQVANRMLATAEGERAGTQQLRQRLLEGHSIDVAGYELAPDLALALEATDLTLPMPPARLAWLEVASDAHPDLTPASRLRVEALRRAGHAIDTRAVQGVAFWQTLETSECPGLIEATTEVVQAWQA